jgi:hypothetical protein
MAARAPRTPGWCAPAAGPPQGRGKPCMRISQHANAHTGAAGHSRPDGGLRRAPGRLFRAGPCARNSVRARALPGRDSSAHAGTQGKHCLLGQRLARCLPRGETAHARRVLPASRGGLHRAPARQRGAARVKLWGHWAQGHRGHGGH